MAAALKRTNSTTNLYLKYYSNEPDFENLIQQVALLNIFQLGAPSAKIYLEKFSLTFNVEKALLKELQASEKDLKGEEKGDYQDKIEEVGRYISKLSSFIASTEQALSDLQKIIQTAEPKTTVELRDEFIQLLKKGEPIKKEVVEQASKVAHKNTSQTIQYVHGFFEEYQLITENSIKGIIAPFPHLKAVAEKWLDEFKNAVQSGIDEFLIKHAKQAALLDRAHDNDSSTDRLLFDFVEKALNSLELECLVWNSKEIMEKLFEILYRAPRDSEFNLWKEKIHELALQAAHKPNGFDHAGYIRTYVEARIGLGLNHHFPESAHFLHLYKERVLGELAELYREEAEVCIQTLQNEGWINLTHTSFQNFATGEMEKLFRHSVYKFFEGVPEDAPEEKKEGESAAPVDDLATRQMRLLADDALHRYHQFDKQIIIRKAAAEQAKLEAGDWTREHEVQWKKLYEAAYKLAEATESRKVYENELKLLLDQQGPRAQELQSAYDAHLKELKLPKSGHKYDT